MLSDELIERVQSYGVKRRKTSKPSWTHKVVTVVKLVVQFLVQEVRYKLEVSRDNARDTRQSFFAFGKSKKCASLAADLHDRRGKMFKVLD